MHSSTSSSDRRIPIAPWGRVWLIALLITILALGGIEVFWRAQGHVPTVVDDPDLWSLHRSRVADAGRDAIVLLGASRIQLDLSMETLRQAFPHRDIIQLAIDGKHPLAVLRDLAENTSFAGNVVCAVTAMGFERQFRDDQEEYVRHYHSVSTHNMRLNRLVSSIIQDRLVIVDPYLKADRVIDCWMKAKRLPNPRYLVTRHDRSRLADYSLIDIEKQHTFRIKRINEIYAEHPPPEEWRRQAAEIRPVVEKITGRGGKVVFVRLPSTGDHWEIDERFYPREEYWDRIGSLTGAQTIHFRDIEGMKDVVCPEGSHLDRRDAPAFTRVLADQLRRFW